MGDRRWWQRAGIGAVAIYGGYFNGGLGILLMAILSLNRNMSLNTVNGLKNYLSALPVSYTHLTLPTKRIV